jgi:hypothetical protein
MHPDNIGQQFSEHLNAISKMQRLDDRFGDNYGFTTGGYHNPENGVYHSVMYTRGDRKWAGEMVHYDDGHVGHLYVDKDHRMGLPSLILHASHTALQHGGEAPRTGRDMTPKAEKLFRNQLPATRNSVRVEMTKPIDTYGDK